MGRRPAGRAGGAASGLFGKAAGHLFPGRRGPRGGNGGRPAAPGARPGGRDRPGTDAPRRGGTDRSNARTEDGRSLTDDPIDVVTGEVLLAQTDVLLRAALPLVLERTHLSTFTGGRMFGPSWASTLDQALQLDAAGVRFLAADATVLTYAPVLLPGVAFLPVAGRRRELVLHGHGGYTLTDPVSGRTLHFPAPGDEHGWSRLPVVAITDRDGARIDFVRDGGRLTEIRHSGGPVIDVACTDPRGTGEHRVTALTLRTGDPAGLPLVRFGYDDAGHLAEVTDSSGVPLRFTYDDDARLTGWQDRNGHAYRYEYDEHGRAVRGLGTGGHLNTALAHDPENRRTAVTDSLGHTTTYRYNDLGQVVEETGPLGATIRTTWDDDDHVLARTDPLGATTRYGYDDAGDLVSVARPDGTTTTAAYDAAGRPVLLTDADGATWRQEFDERGHLVAVTDPAGGVTRRRYDEHGHLAAITDPLGATTAVTCDALGAPVAVVDPRGARTAYAYDPLGRPASVTGPLGDVTRYGWTVEGRPAWRRMPDGATEHWAYDGEGNQTGHTDAAGRTTTVEYGPFDVPVAQIRPDGTRFTFTHDTELRLTRVTDPAGRTWIYERDATGAVRRETDFGGAVTTYEHDAAGRLTNRTNAVGQTVRYRRDAAGRVVEKDADGTVTTFHHDARGLLRRAEAPGADVRLERDALGRVIAEHCNGGGVRSAFDARGRRTARTGPTGARSVWEYDAAGLPRSVTAGGTTVRFDHDAAGRETTRRIGAGAILTQQWDARDRLTRQDVWGAPHGAGPARTLQGRAYAHGPDDGVTASVDGTAGQRRYEHDPLGRITAVLSAAGREEYAYGPAGHLVRAAVPGEPGDGSRDYDGPRVRRAGNVRYEYDAAGRMVLRQRSRLSGPPMTWRFGWDAEDRLTGVLTPSGERWTYVYDAFGRRVTKLREASGGGVAERVDFTWDGPVLAEETRQVWSAEAGAYAGTGTSFEYEPGGFRPLAQIVRRRDASGSWDDGRFTAIVADLAGTPEELVTPSGEVVWRRRATLWGAAREPGPCPLRFPGQYFDAETGLHYNHHRYYDPDSARYVTGDPIGLAGGPDPYAYVTDPLTTIDPLGLAPCTRRLNLGAGNNRMDGAVNTDLRPGSGVDVQADANRLPFRDGSFNEVHAINPYGYNPVNPETARVLEPGGTLSVTGSPKNKFIRTPADAGEMGFELVSEGPMTNAHRFGTQALSNGQPLTTTDNHVTRVYRRL
ncbi:RHS repeat-associated core domain-containing protein [Actinomadura flavalba]|uniref:RHS repeat-associated core domain-containing protein n=1 Tax=Actinomadura flavalba TaxID=1120938 RepID=UPI0003714E4D|nr:RHS repeat-associated core domain-containing protein [Actinomadura flavalba]